MRTAVPSGEFAIFMLALPAFLSPLIVMPWPEELVLPRTLSLGWVAVCSVPRLWAAVASASAVAWALRGNASRVRKAIGAGIALSAWIPAWYSASVVEAMERF
jgi:hypothetical protein